MIVEAEIRQRRHCGHFCILDAAVRVQGEGEEGVFDGAVSPVCFEGVVLPGLEVANHSRGMVEGDDQGGVSIFCADGDGAVPGVVVDAGIFFQRQGRLGVGGAGGFGLLHGFCSFSFVGIFYRLVGCDPVGGRQVKVRIQHVIEDGIEGAALFGVGENDDAEIFFGHEHDARDKSTDPAGVADELAAVIIAQSPAQGVVGELCF